MFIAANTNSQTYKSRWLRKLHRADVRPRLWILVDGLAYAEAGFIERDCIQLAKLLGDRLTNGTIGGEGTVLTGAAKIKFAKAASLRMQKMRADPVHRANNAASIKRKYDTDPGYRARQLAGMQERRADPIFKQKHSDGIKRRWQDPEYILRMKEVYKKRNADPVWRANVSAAMRKTAIKYNALKLLK